MTYRFNSDYTEGCHPAVLEKLVQTNMEQTDGYGLDPYCDEARKLIREAFACPNADVHFLVGGTQTNLDGYLRCITSASCCLRRCSQPYQYA